MPTLKAAPASAGNQSALETDHAKSQRPAESPSHLRFSARALMVSSILASLLTGLICFIVVGGSGSDFRLQSCPTCTECTACAQLISPSCPVNPAPAFAAASPPKPKSMPKPMPKPKSNPNPKQTPNLMPKSVAKNLPEKSHTVAHSAEETKVAPPTKAQNPCVHQILTIFTTLRN
jgi:hypothetical protein